MAEKSGDDPGYFLTGGWSSKYTPENQHGNGKYPFWTGNAEIHLHSWWMFHCHIHWQARCFTPHRSLRRWIQFDEQFFWMGWFNHQLDILCIQKFAPWNMFCFALKNKRASHIISLHCHFLNRRKESIWIPWKDLRKLRTGPAIATFPEASFQKETVVAHALFGFLARTYCGCPRRESVFQLVWIERSECQAGGRWGVAHLMATHFSSFKRVPIIINLPNGEETWSQSCHNPKGRFFWSLINQYVARWWFQMFLFSPLPGEMLRFDEQTFKRWVGSSINCVV